MVEIRAPKSALEWELYFDLRYRILREPLNQPHGSEKNDGDEVGIHFALFKDGIILAIARLDNADNPLAQVRFVAVENNQQGKGYGKKIMIAVEEFCKESRIDKIILHARENAVDFYLNMNYTLIEKSHKLFDVLQHFLMEKQIK